MTGYRHAPVRRKRREKVAGGMTGPICKRWTDWDLIKRQGEGRGPVKWTAFGGYDYWIPAFAGKTSMRR